MLSPSIRWTICVPAPHGHHLPAVPGNTELPALPAFPAQAEGPQSTEETGQVDAGPSAYGWGDVLGHTPPLL